MTAGGRAHAVLSTAAVAATTLGALAPTMAAGADLELGRHLATECITCHSPSARSAIPNIFGVDRNHLVDVIKAYREKALPNPVMQNIAGRLSDEEIGSLALYLATRKKP